MMIYLCIYIYTYIYTYQHISLYIFRFRSQVRVEVVSQVEPLQGFSCSDDIRMYVYIYTHQHIPVVPRKGVAEVSTIGNPKESLVVVNQGWQSEATDGSKGD